MRSETRVQSEQRAEQAAPVRSALRVQSRSYATAAPMRGLSVTPMLPATPSTAALNLYRMLNDARADGPMWTLDAQWLSIAQWASMKACIAQHNMDGPYDSQPWDAPGIVAAGGCKNWLSVSQPPSCDWGFWRLSQCSLDVASRYSFQFSRYLWAQTRMREHLARRPVPGGANYTTAAVAADWAWEAAQLISVLLWSTNVRFDSGYGAVRQVDEDLVAAGLLLERTRRVWDPRRGWTGHERGAPQFRQHYEGALPQLPPPDSGAWQSLGRVWELVPTVFNYLGNDPVAPVDRNGFSPAFEPLWTNPLLRFGPSDSAEMVTQPLAAMADVRGADDRTVFRRWFALNWLGGAPAWVRTPQTVYEAKRTHQHPTPDWTRSARTLWTTSPQWIVNDLAEQLAHYSDPTHTYFDWMQTALRTYDINTPVPNTTVAGQDFIGSKHDLLEMATRAATDAHALAIAPGARGGDSATGAMIVQTGIALVTTIASMVLPVVGLFFTAFNYLTAFATNLITASIPEGPKPCPSFPFIRVMSPPPGTPCALTVDEITSSLLSITSNARWPVAIGGQTRVFSIDGVTVPVTFTPTDTTADAVARRINAAAALVLPLSHPTVAVVTSAGQVAVRAVDPAQPPRAIGGNAAALGFPGPLTGAPTTTAPPPLVAPNPPTASGGGGGAVPLAVGALLALKLLFG